MSCVSIAAHKNVFGLEIFNSSRSDFTVSESVAKGQKSPDS